MRRQYGDLSNHIICLVDRFGPVPLVTLARICRRHVWEVESAVRNCYALTIDDSRMVRLDEIVNDPDYGPIFRKEAVMLRAEGAPTLREIRERCDELRRMKEQAINEYRLCNSSDSVEERLMQLIESDRRAIWMTATGLASMIGCTRSEIMNTAWWKRRKDERKRVARARQKCL